MATITSPIIHVRKTVPIFQFDSVKPIQLGITPDDAADAISQIQANIKQYEAACQPAVVASMKTEGNTTTADSNVADGILSGKISIVISAMSKEFQAKYSKDIKRYTTAADLLNFVKKTFGEYSPRQRQSEAKKELMNTTRRISDNEAFELFLARLSSIGAKTSDKDDVSNQYIEDAFRSNLTPQLNAFLLEHDKLESSCSVIAKFLDEKQKHRKSAEINMIGKLNKIDALEQLMMDQMAQMSNLTKMVQESLHTRDQNTGADINSIRSKTTSNKSSNWRRPAGPKKAERCAKCGMFNHTTRECHGKCRIICRRCNQMGHLEYVCKLPKNE